MLITDAEVKKILRRDGEDTGISFSARIIPGKFGAEALEITFQGGIENFFLTPKAFDPGSTVPSIEKDLKYKGEGERWIMEPVPTDSFFIDMKFSYSGPSTASAMFYRDGHTVHYGSVVDIPVRLTEPSAEAGHTGQHSRAS